MKNLQAFPNPHRTDQTGMSLRDYFAAHATEEDIEQYTWRHTREDAKYMYADNMLKAREA
jgi:hypothetical protein